MALNKKVCVVGLGYIGLPTASLLATKGYEVVGVDVSPHVVDTINQGNIHIVEPELDILVKSAVNSEKLKASLEPAEADVFILAVPTPFKDGKQPNLDYVAAATNSICPVLKAQDLVILESTAPVGTTEQIVECIINQQRPDIAAEVYIAHCPERVLPGQILRELIENDRVVGGVNEKSTEVAVEFYESFVSGEVLATSARAAEMAKLTENAFRDVNIAFANELSMICDELSINVWEVIRLANRHPRVSILNPGPGVGGHCIAVDPWFIVSSAPSTAKLIQTARIVNDSKPHWVIEKVGKYADRFKNPVIGCLGLAFKADVDDLRESPAMEIYRALCAREEWQVLVSEPNLQQLKEVDLLPYEEVIERSDIIVILVDHKKFKRIKASDLKEKVVIDTRGVVS